MTVNTIILIVTLLVSNIAWYTLVTFRQVRTRNTLVDIYTRLALYYVVSQRYAAVVKNRVDPDLAEQITNYVTNNATKRLVEDMIYHSTGKTVKITQLKLKGDDK